MSTKVIQTEPASHHLLTFDRRWIIKLSNNVKCYQDSVFPWRILFFSEQLLSIPNHIHRRLWQYHYATYPELMKMYLAVHVSVSLGHLKQFLQYFLDSGGLWFAIFNETINTTTWVHFDDGISQNMSSGHLYLHYFVFFCLPSTLLDLRMILQKHLSWCDANMTCEIL